MPGAVSTRAEFAALSQSRRRGRSGPLWVSWAPPPRPEGGVCVAFAIGKSVGGAVVRNRIRRRLRVVIADLERRRSIPDGLYLVGARPAAARSDFTDLAEDLRRAMTEAVS